MPSFRTSKETLRFDDTGLRDQSTCLECGLVLRCQPSECQSFFSCGNTIQMTTHLQAPCGSNKSGAGSGAGVLNSVHHDDGRCNPYDGGLMPARPIKPVPGLSSGLSCESRLLPHWIPAVSRPAHPPAGAERYSAQARGRCPPCRAIQVTTPITSQRRDHVQSHVPAASAPCRPRSCVPTTGAALLSCARAPLFLWSTRAGSAFCCRLPYEANRPARRSGD